MSVAAAGQIPQTESQTEPQPEGAVLGVRKIAYIMSRFPKITETFILREMIEIEKQGVQVEVFPLQKEKTNVIHAEARPFVSRAWFCGFLSLAIAWSSFVTILKQPLRFLSTFKSIVVCNWGSRRFLVGAVLFFPKVVHFARIMKRQKIDHVQAHFASHPAMAAFVIHRLTGIDYSFTAHGSDLHRDRHMLCEKVKFSSFTVTISDFNRRLIIESCGPAVADKIRVVHCGVDSTQFTRREKPTLFQQQNGPFRILCVGTLHEVKGQSILLNACAQLQKHGVEYECHLVGDGPDFGKLENLAASLGISNRVRFHGRCDSEKVRELLSESDVLAAPSVPSRDGRMEGIPVVLMEAMASGVAVLSSQLSGIPELVEHDKSGILTEPGDVLAVSNGLNRLAADEGLRQRLSENAFHKVREEFDVTSNSRELLDLIQSRAASNKINGGRE